MGVTSTAPCPIEMFTVSPACQVAAGPLRAPRGWGMRPNRSPPRSMPVAVPNPNAVAYLTMAGAPIFSPAV